MQHNRSLSKNRWNAAPLKKRTKIFRTKFACLKTSFERKTLSLKLNISEERDSCRKALQMITKEISDENEKNPPSSSIVVDFEAYQNEGENGWSTQENTRRKRISKSTKQSTKNNELKRKPVTVIVADSSSSKISVAGASLNVTRSLSTLSKVHPLRTWKTLSS